MSLIQQALEKTNRTQETKTANAPPTPRPYDRDLMGAALERELTKVQQSHAERRGLYWKVVLGVLLVSFAVGLSYVGIRSRKDSPVKAEARGMPQVPVSIVSGYIYRLTGITNLSDRAIAVINNRLVGVGDTLNGRAVVKSIGNGEVCLEIQGKEIILKM